VVHYTATAEELRGRTRDLFTWLARGEVQVHIGGRFPVAQVRDAVTALESRQTTGKLPLVH
jgi:NADPH2:quinone reductase